MTIIDQLVSALEIAYSRVHLLEEHGYEYLDGLFKECIFPVCVQAEAAIQRVRDEVGHGPSCWSHQGRGGCTCALPPTDLRVARDAAIARFVAEAQRPLDDLRELTREEYEREAPPDLAPGEHLRSGWPKAQG